ncbi:MAG TPA: hypothetical protein VK171_01655 [Fimbriimonas sp.]|nr:hypothetical protein [Fimbriimonas sp.]
MGFVESEDLLNVVINDKDRENVEAAAKALQSKRDRDFDFLLITEAKLPAKWEPQWRGEAIKLSLQGLSQKSERELFSESKKRGDEYTRRLQVLLELVGSR